MKCGENTGDGGDTHSNIGVVGDEAEGIVQEVRISDRDWGRDRQDENGEDRETEADEKYFHDDDGTGRLGRQHIEKGGKNNSVF